MVRVTWRHELFTVYSNMYIAIKAMPAQWMLKKLCTVRSWADIMLQKRPYSQIHIFWIFKMNVSCCSQVMFYRASFWSGAYQSLCQNIFTSSFQLAACAVLAWYTTQTWHHGMLEGVVRIMLGHASLTSKQNPPTCPQTHPGSKRQQWQAESLPARHQGKKGRKWGESRGLGIGLLRHDGGSVKAVFKYLRCLLWS